MKANELLTQLNAQQQHAVTTENQSTLILAGAGSGKTRVLVHRIAWLCAIKNSPGSTILAVTFTNKAAGEMQERIKSLVGDDKYQGMWVGTFHGVAHRLLRIFSQQAGLPTNFQLIDKDDQLRLVKRVIRELNLDEKKWSARQGADFIASHKEQGLRPDAITATDPITTTWLRIYMLYHQLCEQAGYVDFSELLLRTYELLKRDQEVLNHCRIRFNYIFVDEFQDTNAIQFQFIKLLVGKTNTIMVVGDDDQSIYGWRGANADNLQHFINEYPKTHVIRLEQNYRSTGSILNAANTLIAKNQRRLGKNLWTEQHDGNAVNVYMGFNDIDEARYVVNQVKKHKVTGGFFADCAILYRNNAQSRLIEDTLLQAAIPYQIYGAIRFYERQEVKKALAYLRLAHNPDDDMAFEQIVNMPARGVGEVTLATLRQTAKQQEKSLWQTSKMLSANNTIKPKPKAGLKRFLELIETLKIEIASLPFHEQLEAIIHDSGLYEMYQQEDSLKSESRRENLEELLSAAKQFYENNGEDVLDTETGKALSALEAFLAYTTLEGKENVAQQDAVQMMTLHSAKGLEFDFVYIVGMEEGLFPGDRAQLDANKMEEERRLLYVGITRARKQLTLSFCQLRCLYGREDRNLPSRFLNELPQAWLNNIGYQDTYRMNPAMRRRDSLASHSSTGGSLAFDKTLHDRLTDSVFELGQRVRHARFGEGTVINLDGEGKHQRVQVAFLNEGIKWLVVKLANLSLLE